MSQPTFIELFQKYIDQTCSPAEVDRLFEMLENGEGGPEGNELLKAHFQDGLDPVGYTDDALRQRLQNRFIQIEQQIAGRHSVPERRSIVWRWVAAAAVMLLAGSAVWYWLTPENQPAVVTAPRQDVEVLPGSDKAVLTLADGKTITLDSSAHGMLGRQGQTTIHQHDGQLVYDASRSNVEPGELIYNTLSTPRGGQYQLTLPEGSKVWLNAASSIRFPAVFNDSARVVYVTGEVYFEVKSQFRNNGKDRMPFVVQVQTANGPGAEIKVLGTHFNINAYDDEPDIKTTLLEGSVIVKSSIGNRQPAKANEFAVVLKPGEQAAIAAHSPLTTHHSPLTINHSPDIKQTLAWKNGLFRFDGVELKTMMRQLSRWYDVEISYEQGAPVSEPFNGAMQRSLQLSQVLKGMEAMGIHVKKEGKRLIVLP